MKVYLICSSVISLNYLNSSHPIVLMALILAQTILICLSAWMKLKVNWFSYILFLIFLGGLMVLFIYIASLASNEMVKMKILKISLMSSLAVAMVIIATNLEPPVNTLTLTFKTYSTMYSWSMLILIGATMLYLLLTLVVVVKMSNKFEAPIKNMIFL